MKKRREPTEEERAASRARVIRTAEWVLAQAYRKAPFSEVRASHLRVREIVVKEARRRLPWAERQRLGD